MEPETLQIKQGDTLSGIAQQRGTTVNALLGANPNITNPDLIIAGQSLKLPSNMNTVQAETLQQAPQGVSVPEAAQVAQPEPFVQSLQTVEPDFFTQQLEQAQAQQNAVEGERTALTDRLEGLLGRLTGRGERAQELTEESGLPQAQRELQDVTTQIAQLRGEFERAINVSEDRLAPTTAIRGEQAAIRRQQAVEIGALTGVAQALQGNIELAQTTIQRAIDMEFEPIEQEIQNTMMFLELNNQNFSRAEKRRAEALQVQLQERSRLLETQKEERLFSRNLAIQAAANTGNAAPLDVVRRATSAETAEDALVLLAPYLTNPLEAEQQLVDLNYKKAQLAYVNSQRDKLEWETDALINGMKSNGARGPQTASQFSAAGFASRMMQAENTIVQLQNQFTGKLSRLGFVPESLRSEDRKLMEQAEANFINAILRKESGAAIGEEEFASARRQYFPQPGDTQAVLEQKEANRSLVIDNMFQEAGIRQTNPLSNAAVRTDDGTVYVMGADGKYYPQ